jgi:hypothetical protein
VSFDLNSYTDVAERIRLFYEKYPDGRLTTVDWEVQPDIGGKSYVWVHAKAYRDPSDPLPGDGIAWEPVPGPTQFTLNSELMNAQTAAWGRAIVALGFETKKIASKQEVEARTSETKNGDPHGLQASRADSVPLDAALTDPANVVIHFSRNKGKTLGELTERQLAWYATQWEPNPEYANDQDWTLKAAAQQLINAGTPAIVGAGPDPDDDIPF